jgi:hypothetical protein
MAKSEEAKALHDAVAGMTRVADALAQLPPERRRRALAVVQQQYRKVMQEAGCDEPDARRWAATLAARLRRLVDVPEGDVGSDTEKLQLLYDELTKIGHDPDTPSTSDVAASDAPAQDESIIIR